MEPFQLTRQSATFLALMAGVALVVALAAPFGSIALGAVALWGFVKHCLRSPHPMLDVRLFAHPVLLATTTSASCTTVRVHAVARTGSARRGSRRKCVTRCSMDVRTSTPANRLKVCSGS